MQFTADIRMILHNSFFLTALEINGICIKIDLLSAYKNYI
jgi:hypothetical protein